MLRRLLLRTVMFLMLAGLPLVSVIGTAAAPAANAAFERTWARTDKPVADLAVNRTWMWGPEANTAALTEAYAEAPGGTRTVQYFDKSRMEDNSYRGTAPWDVTNGLLVVELMTGQMQTGDSTFVARAPAQENVAGDADDPTGPTYATFAGLRGTAANADGATITQRVDRAGTVTNDPTLAGQGVTAAHRVNVPGIDHQVASVFWTFMNSTGTVYENGSNHTASLFENPFYATGYPLTEPYWANVKVGGTYRDVLMQCFERRCLTYTPGNPAGWQVEAGNVGQHYYTWRYSEAAQQNIAVASASGVVNISTSTWTNVPAMSTTITTTTSGDLAVTFSGEGHVTDAGSLIVRAMIDGTQAAPDAVRLVQGALSGTHAFTFAANGIAAGTHTVQLQWMTMPGETATLARRTLTVQATPNSSDLGAMVIKAAVPGPNLTSTSTTVLPIPGMNTSIETGAGANLSITFSAEGDVAGTGQLHVGALVDGTPTNPTDVALIQGAFDGTRTFTFTATGVSPGTHTIQLVGRVDAGNTVTMTSNRTLFVLASPPVAARGGLAVATATAGPIVSTTSTTWADIPGLSATISTPSDSNLAATVSAETAVTAGGAGDIRVVVDGTPMRPSDAVMTIKTITDYRGTQSFTFVLDNLGAGSHTVVVQARVNAAHTFAMSKRSLSVVAWPRQ